MKTHGMSKKNLPEYGVWRGIRYRCNSPASHDYPAYGGRGIKVCSKWNDFAAFLYDMGPRPSDMHTIDRIDVNGDYEPNNCRWVLRAEQNRNKRNSRWVVVGGQRKLFADACRDAGMNNSVVIQKLAHGWSIEQALTRMRRPANTNLGDVAKDAIRNRASSGEALVSIRREYRISGRYLKVILGEPRPLRRAQETTE